MFAHLNANGKVRPPDVSSAGQLILDAGSRQDAIRVYNEGTLSTLDAALKPDSTHFLGRAASVPEGGYPNYMAACFAQCVYRLKPLQSISEAAKVIKKRQHCLPHLAPRRR